MGDVVHAVWVISPPKALANQVERLIHGALVISWQDDLASVFGASIR